MDLSEKIVNALRTGLAAEHVRLDPDDGISGFVVSTRFERQSALDRQRSIDEALRGLSREERRRIVLIAALTPAEYESVGAPVRVHSIRELGDGSVEVVVEGTYSDAAYARGALGNRKGVRTTEPAPTRGAAGTALVFNAKGTKAHPLTKQQAIALLSADPYIHVAQSA